MTQPDLDQLALDLFDIGAVRLGNFTLHSGKRSPIYIDLRLLVSYPAVLKEVAEAYQPLLAQCEYDLLAAYPYAALPIGTAIALQTGRPLIYPRKTAKGYGTGKLVEGVWSVGQTAVVIEDLITSGDSILQAIAALKAAGMQVQDAVVLIDRQQDGKEMLARHGYRLHAVMTLHELLYALERHQKISGRRRAEVINQLY